MTEAMEIIVAAVLVGIGGTAILDLFSFLMERFFGVPATNWRMVGRWLGHMPRGRFVQPDLKQAAPVSGEHAIGWIFHYLVGAGYGLLLVALWGAGWLQAPSFAPPMILVLVLLVLPFFRDDAWHGHGDRGGQDVEPDRDPTEERLRALGLRPRHVCDGTDARSWCGLGDLALS